MYLFSLVLKKTCQGSKIAQTLKIDHNMKNSVSACIALWLQANCLCVFDVCAVYPCVMIIWGWPWGSAPCRHGSSSLFHCHSRMESARGCRETNTQSRTVIHSRDWENQRAESVWRQQFCISLELRNHLLLPLMSVLSVHYANPQIRNSVHSVEFL